MAISFEPTPNAQKARAHYRQIALDKMRPLSRAYDDQEHDLHEEWVDFWWKEGRKGPDLDRDQPQDGMVQFSPATWKIFAASAIVRGSYLTSRGLIEYTTSASVLSIGMTAL